MMYDVSRMPAMAGFLMSLAISTNFANVERIMYATALSARARIR